MKTILLLLLIAASVCLYGQRSKEIDFIKSHLRLNQNKLYIFCRGTKSKSALIAYRFNQSDTNITHVGIAVYQNSSIFIYNVIDNSSRPSALIIDSLQSFIASPDVYYFSAWECDVSRKELLAAAFLLKTYSSRKIYFDAAFKPSENDTLYCSEFCAVILQKTSKRFLFRLRTKPLNNGFYESILERKLLAYYPVDFFEEKKYFKKIFEYRFKG